VVQQRLDSSSLSTLRRMLGWTKRRLVQGTLDSRKVARKERTATSVLMHRIVDHPKQNEQSAFSKMVDDMAATAQLPRQRLRYSMRMPIAGCIMKKHYRSAVLRPKKETRRLLRCLKNDARIVEKQQPPASDMADSKNGVGYHRNKNDTRVAGTLLAPIFDMIDPKNDEHRTKNDYKPHQSVSDTADFAKGNRRFSCIARYRKFGYNNKDIASIASSHSSSHLFGTKSLSDSIIDDLKAIGDAFQWMQMEQLSSTFFHITGGGCMGLRFPDFLRKEDDPKKDDFSIIYNTEDAMDAPVLHKDIVFVHDGGAIIRNNSTLTDSVDSFFTTNFNDETTYDTFSSDDEGGSSSSSAENSGINNNNGAPSKVKNDKPNTK
jgi:hypothetical protein